VDAQVIKQRLRLGEDSRTEFKSVAHSGFRLKPGDLKTLATEIAALANSQGGQIFLGVEDDGTPTGTGSLKQADLLMMQVVQACQTHVHPAIWCPVTKAEIEGKLLLVIDVAGLSPNRPYRADHIFYIRDASMTREATHDELVRMLQSQSTHFDESPVDGATPGDLDSDAVDAFLRGLFDASDVTGRRSHYLRQLKCLDAGDIPTVAGILLFGREIERWFPDARISAVRFPGDQFSSEFADRREITGPLFNQLDVAVGFLERNLPSPAKIEGYKRIERGIPDQVVREALLNAITHRDYRAASQVRLFLFQDRVELINPGLLLNQLTLDSIRLGGISQRRNPVLASLLARAQRRENLGMGVPEMIRQMRACGLPEPLFELQGGHFRVVLRLSPSEGDAR
jgi:ATP-dependent DNA helicase RecG